MSFVRENRQMTNKKLYCEDVANCISRPLKGKYLTFVNDNRPSNNRAASGTSVAQWCRKRMARVFHEAQTK